MAEIKSNGRRNIAIVNGIEVKHFSRNGKEQPNFSCFDEELIQISLGQTVVFDGEVRGRDGDHKSQYKESQKQARRKTNVDTSRLQYVVWDMMPLCDFKMKTCDRTQSKRYDFLRDCVLEYQHTASKGGVNQKIFKVDISKSVTIENEKELKKHFSKVTRKGEEGLIVKNMSGMYEFKRSDTWIKMKLENDVDLKIVGVKEGKKSLKGHLGSVSVMHGKTKVDCPCGKGITRAIAKKLWKNSKELIGKIAKIEYMNVTEDNSLFLPKFVEVRDDKDVSDKPIKKKKKVNKVETKKKKKKKKKA
jgi:ATP-dependent DNA ligase